MIIGNNLHVDAFYDKATSTISYLVMDGETRKCALIDSVLDYDPKSGRTSTGRARATSGTHSGATSPA